MYPEIARAMDTPTNRKAQQPFQKATEGERPLRGASQGEADALASTSG